MRDGTEELIRAVENGINRSHFDGSVEAHDTYWSDEDCEDVVLEISGEFASIDGAVWEISDLAHWTIDHIAHSDQNEHLIIGCNYHALKDGVAFSEPS